MMATAATRPGKDLGPDWRDRFRDSLKRLARRAAGAALLALAVGAAAHNVVIRFESGGREGVASQLNWAHVFT